MASYKGQVYDICIVGAGMIGSATARHASSHSGLKVCLVGPQEPKTRSSNDNGIFGAYYDEGRITSPVARSGNFIWPLLARRSIARYRDLEARTGITFYEERGALFVGPKGSELNEILDSARKGDVKAKLLGTADAKAKFPFINFEDSSEAVYTDDRAGWINPRKKVAAEQTLAHFQGCDIVRDIVNHVMKISQSDATIIYKLETEQKSTIYARKVVIATGAYYNFRQLLPDKIRPRADLMTQTVIFAEVDDTERTALRNMPCVHYKGIYGNLDSSYSLPPIKYPDGKYYVKLGHGSKFERPLKTEAEFKSWFCEDPPQHIKDGLMQELMHIYPGLKLQSVRYDTCVTVHTPGKRPYIDLVSPSMAVALGGNGHAAKCCDELGKIAADLIVKGFWDYDLPKDNFELILEEISSKL